MNQIIIPVILCGGSGTRLWPLSRENAPKQFLKLNGDNSLLQETVDRALKCSGASADQLVTVTLDAMKKQTVQQLNEYDPDATAHILGEPSARNTAAAVAYAAKYVEKQFGRDAIMWVLPADHYVTDVNALRTALENAVEAADQGYLTTFGMQPTRPETGYGYIQMSEEWTDNKGIFSVERFVEKPDRQTAENYIAEGNYVWNSGMFVFKTSSVLSAYEKYEKSIMDVVERATSKMPGLKTVSPEIYAESPEEPFDTAIMENSDKVAVVPCDIGWSDIGSWESVWEIQDKDSAGNALDGRVACVESEDCLIKAGDRLVAAVGLKDVVIIDNGDSVLVADKSSSTAMKTMVKALKKQNARETIDPTMEERPWGQFKCLSQSDAVGYKIKEIIVKPGEKLSLQMHHHRCEFWTVIKGEALVTIDDDVRLVKALESVHIPLQAKHRMENPGTEDLILVEVQCGDYLGEDDIVRFDDIYGRAAA